jgi:hypothetical protein
MYNKDPGGGGGMIIKLTPYPLFQNNQPIYAPENELQ